MRQAAITTEASSKLIEMFKAFYENYAVENLNTLDQIYTQDIEFVDPVHTVSGSLALKNYFRKMAVNLTQYRIRYIDMISTENAAYLTWEMAFAHKKMAGGELVTLRGMSHIKFTSRIYYHEDSYDLGAMVYENLPVMGGLTRLVKNHLAKLS